MATQKLLIMKFEDRKYQDTHSNDIIRLLSRHNNVCAQLPTGGGKTVEFSKIAYRFYHKTSKSVIILVHREELLWQTKATIEQMFNIKCSVIVAGTTWLDYCPVYIGMVESTYKRFERLPEDIGLVIIDECHNASFNKLLRLFTKQYVIGFTATPKSSSKKEPLNKYYGDIAVGPQISELIEMGKLCRNVTRSPRDVVDRAHLAIDTTGEFAINSMAAEFLKTRFVMSTVSAYMQYSAGKKAICYNVNIAHSLEVTKLFNFMDIPCKHVDGETPSNERAEIFKWFKETPGSVLCNVGVATMGFDEPTIETVIINRCTTSMPLWLQMCGRGSRPINEDWVFNNQDKYPYPVDTKELFTIIDMGGNAINHGDWCDERDWYQIFHNPDRPGNGVAPVKECPNCNGIVHAATLRCPLKMPTGEDCGYIFNRKKYEEEKIIGDFITVTRINLDEVMKRGKGFKPYFTFFELGRQVIEVAERTGKDVNTQQFEFLFEGYMNLVREWFKKEFPYVPYDEARHRDLGRTHFTKEFKKKFRKVEDKVYA